MAEKRRAKRFPRRLTLRYGEKELDRTGLSLDVSSTGIFIVAQTTPPAVETRLHVQLNLENGKTLFIEGIVRRQKVAPPELRAVEKAGFGLRFLTGEDLLAELVPTAQAREESRQSPAASPAAAAAPLAPAAARPPEPPPALPFTTKPPPPVVRRVDVPFGSEAALKSAYEKEIKLGGLFVRGTFNFTGNEDVLLVVRLEYKRTEFELRGRVLAVIPGQGAGFGFVDAKEVRLAFAPHL